MKSNRRTLLKSKKSQAQVIVTVLLILIVLAAVGLVSTFIFRLVRENLTGTECFKTLGQFSIDVSAGYTFYNSSDDSVAVSIQRAQEPFNLTGFSIVVEGDVDSKSFDVMLGESITATMYDGSTTILLPNPGEKRTYVINASGISGISKVKIAPIIEKGRKCDIADEVSLPIKE